MSNELVVLGSGSYGKVFSRSKVTAVKISEIKEWDEMQSCAREINCLLQLNDNKDFFFVKMKQVRYVNGDLNIFLARADMNLGDYPKRDLSADTILKWSIHLFRALKYMHDRGFYHRDLKPDNILVKQGTLWLCDFGLARQFSDKASYGTGYIVTRWYRAPELLKHLVDKGKTNDLIYTAKMDIWGMATIVYELVYDTIMCRGKSSEHCLEILQNRKDIGVDIPNDVKERMHDHVKALLVGALDMDPKARFTIGECLHQLESFSDSDLIAYQKRMRFQTRDLDTSLNVFFLPIQPEDKDIWPSVSWQLRKEKFEEAYRKYPSLKSIIAYAIVVFDHTYKTGEYFDDYYTLSMIYAGLVLGGYFIDKYSRNMVEKMKDKYSSQGECFRLVCKHMETFNTRGASMWEKGEYKSFTQFLTVALKNPHKRIKLR